MSVARDVMGVWIAARCGVRRAGRPWRLSPRPLPLAVFTGAGEEHGDPASIVLSGDADPLRGAGSGPLWADPVRVLADASLDGLSGLAVLEARFAALKVLLTADYAEATRALACPTASPRDRTSRKWR